MEKFIPDIDAYIERNKAAIKKIIKIFYGELDKFITERLAKELVKFGFTQGIEFEIGSVTRGWVDKYFKPWVERETKGASLHIMKDIDKLLGVPVSSSIDLINPVLEFITRETGELAVNLNRQQIESIKNVIALTSKNQWGYLRTMELLRPTITLTDFESQAVINEYSRVYAKILEQMSKKVNPSIAREIATRKAQAAAEKKSRYLLNNRTERIARTELGRAYNEGLLNSVQTGINQGKFVKAWKTWRRTNFTDNHESSIGNDNVSIPLWEYFPVPDLFGNPMLYPSEINEHCILEIEFIKR